MAGKGLARARGCAARCFQNGVGEVTLVDRFWNSNEPCSEMDQTQTRSLEKLRVVLLLKLPGWSKTANSGSQTRCAVASPRAFLSYGCPGPTRVQRNLSFGVRSRCREPLNAPQVDSNATSSSDREQTDFVRDTHSQRGYQVKHRIAS